MIICLIIIMAIMIALAVVWFIVMFAFSIMTIGGFFKRRFRTLVIVETENKEFIGKLALMSVQRRGVLEYAFDYLEYDEWMTRAFGMFVRLKHLRQAVQPRIADDSNRLGNTVPSWSLLCCQAGQQLEDSSLSHLGQT